MSLTTRNPRVSDANSRIRNKRRQTRLRRIRGAVIGVAVLAVLAGGLWVVGFSPLFAVTTVEVNGTKLLSADSVRQAAMVPVGSSVALAEPEPIAKRVGAIAEVKSVTVRRTWPNTITIDVTERSAVYALKSSVAGEFWLVDADGVTFHTVKATPKGTLVAQSDTTDIKVLADTATVVAAIPDKLRKCVLSLRVVSADDITLVLSGNAKVVWGGASDSKLKGQVAEALLSVKASVYDVSSPTAPVTR